MRKHSKLMTAVAVPACSIIAGVTVMGTGIVTTTAGGAADPAPREVGAPVALVAADIPFGLGSVAQVLTDISDAAVASLPLPAVPLPELPIPDVPLPELPSIPGVPDGAIPTDLVPDNPQLSLVTGSPNLGGDNDGNFNAGLRNDGDFNTGTDNDGNFNLGSRNVGNYSIGSGNNGDANIGTSNVGDFNVGSGNRGVRNVGFNNTGRGNFGIGNTGDGNIGVFNSGNTIGAFGIGLPNPAGGILASLPGSDDGAMAADAALTQSTAKSSKAKNRSAAAASSSGDSE